MPRIFKLIAALFFGAGNVTPRYKSCHYFLNLRKSVPATRLRFHCFGYSDVECSVLARNMIGDRFDFAQAEPI